jgi:hypothetical protein
MWAVGLVVAGAVLAGLVLNLAGGLTRLSWAITLAVAVLCWAGAWLAARRKRAGPQEAAAVPKTGFALPLAAVGYLLLAAALAGVAVWLAAASASWPRSPGFAQLWLVPAQGQAFTLGVRDNYPERHTFRLVLHSGATTVASWDLNLANGGTWQRAVTQPAGGPLVATLTTPDQELTVAS